MLSLEDVRVVDQHCHGVLDRQLDRDGLRRACTESRDPRMLEVAASSVAYSRLLARLAGHLGCAPDEDSVVAARAARDPLAHAVGLLAEAGVGALLLDDGYPPQDECLPPEQLGCPVAQVLRLEPRLERLVAEQGSLDALRDAVRELVRRARAQGVVGLKTVVGYRTGLGMRRHGPDDVAQAWRAARRDVADTGSVRLGHAPLLDTLLYDAFEVAGAERLPVQVHVGYGDADADLRTANPLELRPTLQDPALAGTDFVLLHGCWPFVREGGYLASVFGNVWLDVSYGIPFLSRAELVATTRAAVGVTPLARLVYSSDGASLPELHWDGAREGRWAVTTALTDLVTSGELAVPAARAWGERVLAGNARRLYGLPQ